MNAMPHTRVGPPDVLRLGYGERPAPRARAVRTVHAAAMDDADAAKVVGAEIVAVVAPAG